MGDDGGFGSAEALNEPIARIYDGVLRLSFETFKERTLRELQTLLPFDSGVWASGPHSTNTIHSVAIINQSPEMLMNYAVNWQAHDFVRAAAVAQPGVAFRNEDVMALEDYHRTAIYREFSSPSGIEHALGVVHLDPVTDLGEMLFLFRAEPAAFFSNAERDLLQLLLPHLVTAWRQRQALHTHESRSPAAFLARHHAVIDDEGLLQAADAQFSAMLRQAMPGWTGPRLPDKVVDMLKHRQDHVSLNGLDFLLTRGPARHVLAVSRREEHSLTRAETRVARLFADGRSNSQIAALLGVSPATIRNQLASIYRKLDIHSKAELARLFPSANSTL